MSCNELNSIEYYTLNSLTSFISVYYTVLYSTAALISDEKCWAMQLTSVVFCFDLLLGRVEPSVFNGQVSAKETARNFRTFCLRCKTNI